MKRIIIILSCFILLAMPVTAFASDGGDPSAVAITVVIPKSEAPRDTQPPQTAATVPANYLYPISVNEQRENGQRTIIKTYELGVGEKPGDISRESFVRDGWLFELTDIVKKEAATTDSKELVEKVTLDTATNDTEAILRLFNPTLDYTTEDGYFGTLTLDISSIKVETGGTKQETFTANVTREYPHLSSNDSSLVPKTVTDNGRDYTLVSVDWKSQNNTTIDYTQIADSYTAVAKYTRTGYKNVVTGYVATAEYKGNVAKIITGKTLYTAYFLGVQIITPVLTNTTTNTTPETTAETITAPVVTPEPTMVPNVTEEPTAAADNLESTTNTAETEAAPTSSPKPEATAEPQAIAQPPQTINPFLMCALVILGIGVGGGIVYFLLRNKKKEDEPHEETD